MIFSYLILYQIRERARAEKINTKQHINLIEIQKRKKNSLEGQFLGKKENQTQFIWPRFFWFPFMDLMDLQPKKKAVPSRFN